MLKQNPTSNSGDQFEEMVELAQSVKIKAAQLKGEFCHYTYDHRMPNGATNRHTVKSSILVHPDLKAAFALFNAHLAVICEEVAPKDVRDIDAGIASKDAITEKLKAFSVDSFQLVGDGIIISGEKLLSTGDSVKLETPKIEFGGSYQFDNELYAASESAIAEVMDYHNGKERQDPQMELFTDEEKA